MSETATLAEKATKKTNGTKSPVKRPRALTFERLEVELTRQPLKDKIKLLASLKHSIATDKKLLEEQLSLIEGTGND